MQQTTEPRYIHMGKTLCRTETQTRLGENVKWIHRWYCLLHLRTTCHTERQVLHYIALTSLDPLSDKTISFFKELNTHIRGEFSSPLYRISLSLVIALVTHWNAKSSLHCGYITRCLQRITICFIQELTTEFTSEGKCDCPMHCISLSSAMPQWNAITVQSQP